MPSSTRKSRGIILAAATDRREFREGQGGGDIEIVGVVSDASEGNVRLGPLETVYLPEKQGQTSGLTLLVRTADEPRRVIPTLLEIVQRIDRRLPVYSMHTMDLDIQAGYSGDRILGFLSTLFAALATLLAGIGLYGVLAYSVARRRREIGIRFAVGAQRHDVAGLFARECLGLVLAGLVGAPMALISASALGSLLFGVRRAMRSLYLKRRDASTGGGAGDVDSAVERGKVGTDGCVTA